MKKTSFSILFLLFLGIIFLGCGKNGSSSTETSNGKKIITVWAWDKNFNIAIMEEAAKRYSTKNKNIEIKIIDVANEEVRTKLQVSFSSGVQKGLPEIILMEDYHIQKFLTSYPGKFSNLTDKINYKNFAKYKVTPMTLNQKIYGIPFDSGVGAIFYRRDYLKTAGYSEKDLENITWDKFIEIGINVKEKTGKYMFSTDINNDPGILRMIMQSSGKWFFDKDGNVTIANNSALKSGIIIYQKMLKAGIIHNSIGWGNWVATMNNNEVASVISGAWIVASIKLAKDQEGKWGVAPFPRLSNEKSYNASNLGGSSWYVLEDSSNKNEAVEFLKEEFANDLDLYNKILIERGAIGTYLPAQKVSAYNEQDKFFANEKINAKFAKYMNQIPAINYGLYVAEADAALAGVIKEILDGTISVNDGLKKAEEQLKAQIK